MGNTAGRYQLGIDLGTTYTAAAVWEAGRAEIVTLGDRTMAVPSVLLLRDDGTMLFGEAAERRGSREPRRVVREFKRRVGDPAPVVVGGSPFAAEALMAKLLRWVVDSVSERQGGPPDRFVVAHPANWGQYRRDLLEQAIRSVDLDGVSLVTEPEAAAIHYSSQERVPDGTVVAVYDLGGGTFDAAVLRSTSQGWEAMGQPEGIERLGGIDFDEALFRFVIETAALEGYLSAADADADLYGAVNQLRRECVVAKEALSSDTDTDIAVTMPELQTRVRLTRVELEEMIRPTLRDSIGALQRALRSASVTPAEIDTVLLVGGSSRIPLVGQLVSAELARPVAIDAHPKHSVALGAALVAANAADGPAPAGAFVAPVSPPAASTSYHAPAMAAGPAGFAAMERQESLAIGTDTYPSAARQPAVTPTGHASAPGLSPDGRPPRRRSRGPLLAVGAGALGLALVVAGVVSLLFLLPDDGGDEGGDDPDPEAVADQFLTALIQHDCPTALDLSTVDAWTGGIWGEDEPVEAYCGNAVAAMNTGQLESTRVTEDTGTNVVVAGSISCQEGDPLTAEVLLGHYDEDGWRVIGFGLFARSTTMRGSCQ